MAEAPKQYNNTLDTLSKLEQYHSEGKYWDVQIRVNTEVFKCHRWLLAANSEYFERMFSSNNFAESNTSKDDPITLTEMDASAFEELLHFMYTGEIRVKDSNVLPLLFMSDFLTLRSDRVKKQCLKHVKNRSQEDEPMSNAIDLLGFTRLKGEKVFINTIRAHICRHLHHYSKDARLLEITFENLNALLQLSRIYILPLRGSADLLLEVVYNWINYNRDERRQYRSNLLENINFANLSSEFFQALINRLDNLANISKDIESHSELNMLFMGMATNLTDSIGQFDSMISYRFENVSEMQINYPAVYSSSCIISDLSWKIGIKREDDELGMFLYCDGTPSTAVWNCYASATFTIVSHKEGRHDFVGEIVRSLFASNKEPAARDPGSRIKWNDLIDSANGYLYDDDSITVKVHVCIDVPFLKMM